MKEVEEARGQLTMTTTIVDAFIIVPVAFQKAQRFHIGSPSVIDVEWRLPFGGQEFQRPRPRGVAGPVRSRDDTGIV